MRINVASLGSAALVVLVAMGAEPATVGAQTAGFGYAFGGPAWVQVGITDSAWHIGIGGERLSGAVGIGAELGYVYLPPAEETFPGGGAFSPGGGGATLSVNGSYHFGGRRTGTRSARPFVTGGITYVVGAFLLPDFGGGLDWWVTRRAGLRFEVREQVIVSPMLGFRGGVVFR